MDGDEFWKQTINYAVNNVADRVVEKHPLWETNRDYIIGHIDKGALDEVIKKVHADLSRYEISSLDNFREHFNARIADYIASGEILDDPGKEIILRKSLESRAQNAGWFSGRKDIAEYQGEQQLERTIEAFGDLYFLMRSGKHEQRMPELAEALQTIDDAKFLKPALDLLRKNNLMDDERYEIAMKALGKKVDDAGKAAVRSIGGYLTPRQEEYAGPTETTDITKYAESNGEGKYAAKIAASILGILGIGILVSTQTSLTGGAIGTLPTSSIGIYGIGAIFLAMIVFLFGIRKKNKKQKKK